MKTITTRSTSSRSLMLLTMLLTMSLTLSLAFAVQARPGGRGGPGMGKGKGGPGGGLCRMLKKADLGLSEEQEAALQPICVAMPERVKPIREAMHELRDEIRAEMEKDEVDLATVGALHQQIAALKTDMAALRVETRAQLREILDAEQLSTLKALKEKRRERRRSRRVRGGPGGGFGRDQGGGSDAPGLGAPGGESW